ncbi:MAG: putative transposase, partial [Thermomicrobiales bacterium]|nr:putative transposase [Thermomicrobiales bacterium]
MTPAQRRAVVAYFRAGVRVGERRAGRVAGVPRATCRDRSQARDHTALRVRLRDLAAARVRYGCRRLHVLSRREGWRVDHKRVYRLYREEGLGIRVKRKTKRTRAPRVQPAPAPRPRERWRMDFLTGSLADGRRFRVLTVVDHVSRVSPAIGVDVSWTGERVAAILEGVRRTTGAPERIAVDNGPEFTAKALNAWASLLLNEPAIRKMTPNLGGVRTNHDPFSQSQTEDAVSRIRHMDGEFVTSVGIQRPEAFVNDDRPCSPMSYPPVQR